MVPLSHNKKIMSKTYENFMKRFLLCLWISKVRSRNLSVHRFRTKQITIILTFPERHLQRQWRVRRIFFWKGRGKSAEAKMIPHSSLFSQWLQVPGMGFDRFLLLRIWQACSKIKSDCIRHGDVNYRWCLMTWRRGLRRKISTTFNCREIDTRNGHGIDPLDIEDWGLLQIDNIGKVIRSCWVYHPLYR